MAVLFFAGSYTKLSGQWRNWLLATIETLLGSSLSMHSFILGKEWASVLHVVKLKRPKPNMLFFSCVQPFLFSCVVVSDIEDLPPAVQEKLFDEVLDRDVQKGDFPCCYSNWDHFRSLGNQIHDVLYQDSCQTLPVLCYQYLCYQPSKHTVLTLAGC